mmetsp:Transcript_15736/g.34033  ORF Transcript_15736/g.34033 Transcript_15736/m.34033 type:complete len:302 (+) Transcript_15736:69-974(+)
MLVSTVRGSEQRPLHSRRVIRVSAFVVTIIVTLIFVFFVSKSVSHAQKLDHALSSDRGEESTRSSEVCSLTRDISESPVTDEKRTSIHNAEWTQFDGVLLPIGDRVGHTEKRICVTHRAFMDLAFANGTSLGRIEIALFGTIAPKSVQNFVQLCTCELALLQESKFGHLCFHDDSFHRVVRKFVVQGGNHATGRSVFGSTFREQESEAKHSVLSHKPGVLAYAEYPIGSQFYIVTAPYSPTYLDANHVVFALVIKGMNLVYDVEALPLEGDKPLDAVRIKHSGLLPLADISYDSKVSPPSP